MQRLLLAVILTVVLMVRVNCDLQLTRELIHAINNGIIVGGWGNCTDNSIEAVLCFFIVMIIMMDIMMTTY